MSSGERDRFLALSPTFYGKERSLADMCLETEGLVITNQDVARFLQPYPEVKTIVCGRKGDQSATLEKDPTKVLQQIFEVLEKGQTNKILLMSLLPTLDGILFGTLTSCKFWLMSSFLSFQTTGKLLRPLPKTP
jgi:hypothetical protein